MDKDKAYRRVYDEQCERCIHKSRVRRKDCRIRRMLIIERAPELMEQDSLFINPCGVCVSYERKKGPKPNVRKKQGEGQDRRA